MAGETRVVMDNAALQRFLSSPDGPAMREVAKRAQRVKEEARARAPVSDPSKQLTSRGQAQHMRDTIVTRIHADAEGPAWLVGTDRDYAGYVHDGTPPHVIVPVRAKVLRFTTQGRVVFARRVNHPGTRPNPFLTDAARALGLKVRRRRR